jgi:hypothetical protein
MENNNRVEKVDPAASFLSPTASAAVRHQPIKEETPSQHQVMNSFHNSMRSYSNKDHSHRELERERNFLGVEHNQVYRETQSRKVGGVIGGGNNKPSALDNELPKPFPEHLRTRVRNDPLSSSAPVSPELAFPVSPVYPNDPRNSMSSFPGRENMPSGLSNNNNYNTTPGKKSHSPTPAKQKNDKSDRPKHRAKSQSMTAGILAYGSEKRAQMLSSPKASQESFQEYFNSKNARKEKLPLATARTYKPTDSKGKENRQECANYNPKQHHHQQHHHYQDETFSSHNHQHGNLKPGSMAASGGRLSPSDTKSSHHAHHQNPHNKPPKTVQNSDRDAIETATDDAIHNFLNSIPTNNNKEQEQHQHHHQEEQKQEGEEDDHVSHADYGYLPSPLPACARRDRGGTTSMS